jgi:hypothetical protein
VFATTRKVVSLGEPLGEMPRALARTLVDTVSELRAALAPPASAAASI